MAELGHIVLLLAFVAAVITAVLALISAAGKSGQAAARRGVFTVFALYTLAMVIVVVAFITRDFSLRIVAEHVNRDMSLLYTLSAVYADKAGSLLLWGWLTSLASAVFVWRRDPRDTVTLPLAIMVLALLQMFFLGLVSLVADVFVRSPQPVAEGFGMNPLLRNVGMLIHPPLLYISFAAIAVVFALTIAALVRRQPAAAWAHRVRHWAVFAWITLGLGNIVGMWWSYNELGWGGYWAWDPVENAGLMPWLLATALLHSLVMLRNRAGFRLWSLSLAVFTFIFTLLIPFITHGGVESPLHGFQGSPFPSYILGAMLLTLAVSLWLLWRCRGDAERAPAPFSVFSREGAFLAANVVLVLLTAIVFIGTVLPGLVGLQGDAGIAVDRSFYDRTAGPLFLLLVLLLGICPLLGRGRSLLASLRGRLLYPLLAALGLSLVIALVFGFWYGMMVLVCAFPAYTILAEWWRGSRALGRARRQRCWRAFVSLLAGNRARYGGYIVHLGIILIALGVIGSSFFLVERTATLDVGQSLEVGDYQLSYDTMLIRHDAEMVRAVARITVQRDGHILTVMAPEFNYWYLYDDFFAESTARTTPLSDLFVSMVWTSFDPADKAATFRVKLSPLLIWIWVGGGLLLLGGVLAFSATPARKPEDAP